MELAELQQLLTFAPPEQAQRRFNDLGPVWQLAEGPWVVSGYDEVHALLRNPRLSSGAIGQRFRDLLPPGAAQDYMAHRINFLDPPRHTVVRHAIDTWFTPKRVRDLRPTIVEIADDLLASAEGTCDLVELIAHPLPSLVICGLLGAKPPEGLADWTAKTAALIQPALDEDAIREGCAAAEEFAAWVSSLDLPAIDLPDREHVSLVMTLFAAGHHTTRDLFANGMHALLRHRDQIPRALQNPATAVLEFLRYDSPTQLLMRIASEPFEISGAHIEAGSELLLLLGAANRDPRHYEDPERFDVSRGGSAPLSFGLGPHFCLGAPLARLEAAVMLESVLQRWPSMTLVDPDAVPPRRPSMTFHGITSLPVRLK